MSKPRTDAEDPLLGSLAEIVSAQSAALVRRAWDEREALRAENRRLWQELIELRKKPHA